ncbi:MAG: four-carbon acid sugar kinase family protein [Vampirovibrionales bacterium]|nr:four-carbon acid sugar kinase family protein [Vampirovibrionales bacterium]
MPDLTLGIVADDLTGAGDTALPFFLDRRDTVVLASRDWADALDNFAAQGGLADSDVALAKAWVLNTQSRHSSAATAAEITADAFKLLKSRLNCDLYYKKIDSTLRGHVAAECLAAVEALEADCGVIVPAFPEQGRQTVGGYQLVHGIPLERSDVARDPLAPMGQTYVPKILADDLIRHHGEGADNLLGYVPLGTVLHGAGPILMALQAQAEAGKKLVLVDAATTEDLNQIALALEKSRKNLSILPCGAGGLANALIRHWPTGSTTPLVQESGDLQKDLLRKRELYKGELKNNELKNHELEDWPWPSPAGADEFLPTLLVVGSYSRVTQIQLEALLARRRQAGQPITFIGLSPRQILGLSPTQPTVDTLALALNRGQLAVVSTVVPTELPSHPEVDQNTYEETLKLAEENEISVWDAKLMAQNTLAQVVKAVLDAQPARLLICGGETSYRVFEAIGGKAFCLAGQLAPQVPLCLEKRQNLPERWIVTKSGGFGPPELLIDILDKLNKIQALK